MLISLSGVPGSGKTTIAQELARRLRGVHIEVDVIERALQPPPGGPSSYRVAYSIAQARAGESLRLGRSVIADCVNPNSQVRDEWLELARLAGVTALEVEVVCSDAGEYQRRLSGSASDARRLTRSEEVTRFYQSWDRQHLVVDTALQTVEASVGAICRVIRFRHT